MGKKFVGLDGLKHFWTKVKTWIAGQITSEVTAKIAEIVANAPEDLDTLKEIADWISTHANDASAMNTQINTNKNDIAALQTSVTGKADTGHTHDDRYYTESEVDKKLAGKSNVEHTHTKSEITDFAHTHDDRYFTETEVTSKLAGKSDTGHKHSASDITSGTLPVGRGGTGATDAASGFNTLADGVRDSSKPADNEKMLLKPEGPWYKTTCLDFWNYIKGKADSVYAKANRYYFDTHNVYRCLGTATLRQGGDYLLIRVFSGNGYNAILGQDRAFDIHLRTSNGKDLNGLYYAGYVEYHLNGSSSSLVYVVQNSATSFTIWVGLTNYTGRAFYTVENSDGSSWSSSTETSTSIPSGAAQLTAKQIAYNTEDVTFTTAKASNKMVIPIGAPSSLEDGCIWIQ